MDFGIIILAIVQGIAEFLPISSSAHLLIFRDLFGIGASITENVALTFDVALHFGTLLAIGVFFFKDFISMISKGLTKGVKDDQGKIFWYLIAATIPGAIMGILFEDAINNIIRNNFFIIGSALIIMGVILYFVDNKSKQNRSIKDLTLKDAIMVGCAQVFALIPGFSRSGTTISMARGLKLNREDAAKFSFYLSAPIICGAVLLQIIKSETRALILANLAPFALGIIISFITGLICIKYLLKYLKKHNFQIFMWYRVAMGLLVIILALFR